MGEVVGIYGEPRPEAREPRPRLIEHLTDLLERAKAGELQGLGTVQLHHDGAASWNSCGLLGTYSSVGAAVCLLDDLKNAALGRD